MGTICLRFATWLSFCGTIRLFFGYGVDLFSLSSHFCRFRILDLVAMMMFRNSLTFRVLTCVWKKIIELCINLTLYLIMEFVYSSWIHFGHGRLK